MAIYPSATWMRISGPSEGYSGNRPFRIIHHTTQGWRAQDAFDAYKTKKADPHFTVDDTTIYQHIDTAESARALKNKAGGVQTNRLYAVQIELVGFAEKRKSLAALTNVARLCRWIEHQHGVERKWPSGLPKPATAAGKDPGGHNRDPGTWEKEGGHYGHCHVPENDHWDPAYTEEEVAFLMSFETGAQVQPQLIAALAAAPPIAGFVSTMDHHDFA